MRTINAFCTTALTAVALAATPAVAAAAGLSVNLGGSSASSPGVHVNVGAGSGVTANAAVNTGTTSTPTVGANATLGSSQGTTADAAVNLGNTLGSGGTTANVDLGSGGDGTTADVNADLGDVLGSGGTSADAKLGVGDGVKGTANLSLGSNSTTLPATTLAADLNLLGGGSSNTAGSGPLGNIASLGLDLNGLANAGGGSAGAGGNGGSTAGNGGSAGNGDGMGTGSSNGGGLLGSPAPVALRLTAANCVSPAGRQAVSTAAHTRYSGSALRDIARSDRVAVVPLRFCAQARGAIASAISRNRNIGAMQMAAADAPAAHAALSRAHASPRQILLARRNGNQLALYVF